MGFPRREDTTLNWTDPNIIKNVLIIFDWIELDWDTAHRGTACREILRARGMRPGSFAARQRKRWQQIKRTFVSVSPA